MDYDSDENGNAAEAGPAERGGLSSCGYWSVKLPKLLTFFPY